MRITTEVKKDFETVIFEVVNSMLKMEFIDYNSIYVDMNSLLSAVYYLDNVDSFLLERISGSLSLFIKGVLTSTSRVVFLYTHKPSKLHTTIYPNWCKERYDRVNLSKSVYIEKLLSGLRKISLDNPRIKIINTDELHPVYEMYKDLGDRLTTERVVILSKDNVWFGLPFKNINIWTGVNMVYCGDKKMVVNSSTIPVSSYREVLSYIILMGDDRNSYKGLEGYGKVKTKSYINNNIMALVLNTEHPLKEFMDKHAPLYDFKLGLEYLKNELHVKI
ncbi:MAG: hypothetical protein ACRCX2_21975 [Paraclostridium sp.]